VRSVAHPASSPKTKRILQSGIMEGGKFVLREEATTMRRYTPSEHVKAMSRGEEVGGTSRVKVKGRGQG